jgi:hypothetical protein
LLARIAVHFSGSFRRRRINNAKNAGSAPTTNMNRHGFHSPSIPAVSSGANPMLMNAAVMLPIAEHACSQPSA